jgi:hypothetical protein
VKDVTDDTPHSKHAVYNTLIISTLKQLKVVARAIQVQRKESWVKGVHSDEEGTILIIFIFSEIIFNSFSLPIMTHGK